MLNETLTFLYKNFKHYKVINILDNLKQREIQNFGENNSFQIAKLVDVLKIAFNEVPFYKSLNNTVNFSKFSYDEFQKIPLLTKDHIRLNLEELLNPSFDFTTDTAFKNSSGGSTGEPVLFYRTGSHARHGVANYYYSLINNGVSIYSRSMDLWGAERDMYRGSANVSLKQILNNNLTLNTFVLSDNIIQRYIIEMNRFKPKFIKAYVHSVFEIAKYALANKIKINFKPVIQCTTGPLYPEMKEVISKAFNDAHVYNFYGSREVSSIASEISGAEGLFVLFDNVFIEILDDNGVPVQKGEEGEVVVSTLNNFYMPLIRYRIGDRAIKGDELEFGTLLLDKVVGRTLGVIHKKDGTRIDGQFFVTLFFGKDAIQSFQLIQRNLDFLVLKIVKNTNFNQDQLDVILNRITAELGDVQIQTEFCKKIDVTSTGKTMYVYSEISG